MAYLFECGSTGIFALSVDKTGATLPQFECKQAWLLRRELSARDLSTHYPDCIQELSDKTFCILDLPRIAAVDRRSNRGSG